MLPQKKSTLLAPWSWTSSLQDWDNRFCGSPRLWYLVMTALGNQHSPFCFSVVLFWWVGEGPWRAGSFGYSPFLVCVTHFLPLKGFHSIFTSQPVRPGPRPWLVCSHVWGTVTSLAVSSSIEWILPTSTNCSEDDVTFIKHIIIF